MSNPRKWILAASIVVAVGCGAVLAQGVSLRPLTPIYVDASGAALRKPEGVAYDGKSLIVVADTGNRRLVSFTITEQEIRPTTDLRVREVAYPVTVRIDAAGDLLVLDGKSHRIARVAAAGQFRDWVEIPGVDGRDPMVKSFDLDAEGRVWALDAAGSRIVVTGPGGGVVRSIAVPDEAGFLSDLTVSSTGAVFAIDSVGRRVFVARVGDEALTPLTESMTDEMAFPASIASDAAGMLYVADQNGGGLVVLGQDGSYHGRQSGMGWKRGLLRYPSGMIVRGDYLFVADRANDRIQWFEIDR
jgi:DNA-binding beta-propeller fold protein YncE